MNITGKILIIDDESTVRRTLARILQNAGMEVTSAENGEQGINYLGGSRFDLVFMDIRMPGMAGLEALDVIRSRFPGLPVILFTAAPDLTSAVEALRRGATDYLLKPLKPQAIIDRARSVLLEQAKERRKRELLAQIEALQAEYNQLEREGQLPEPAAALPEAERYLKRGSLQLDTYTRRVTVGDQVISLLPTSFDVLLVLARHAPDVVDYQTLVTEAQGLKVAAREAQELVKWHIHQIRQALESDPHHPKLIYNVRGVGYRLITD